jgi:hypothetical protein
MSLRFILLYFSSLIATTLYFMNMPATSEGLILYERLLGKFINQSTSLLLFFYFLIKYYGKYTLIIKLLIGTFMVFFMGDLMFLISENRSFMDISNNILAIICRILFSIIFVLEGSKFLKIPVIKLPIIIPFVILVIWVYLSIFNQIDNSTKLLSIFSAVVFLTFLWLCANRPVNPKNAWIALIAGAITTYADFNFLFHSYVQIISFTYSWMRTLSATADIFLVWSILSNANMMPQRLKFE